MITTIIPVLNNGSLDLASTILNKVSVLARTINHALGAELVHEVWVSAPQDYRSDIVGDFVKNGILGYGFSNRLKTSFYMPSEECGWVNNISNITCSNGSDDIVILDPLSCFVTSAMIDDVIYIYKDRGSKPMATMGNSDFNLICLPFWQKRMLYDHGLENSLPKTNNSTNYVRFMTGSRLGKDPNVESLLKNNQFASYMAKEYDLGATVDAIMEDFHAYQKPTI